MGQTTLSWSFDGLDPDEFKVYRSDTPMDPEALPTALDTVTGDLREYVDTTVVTAETYYYRVGAVKGTAERVSDEIEHVAEDPRSDWEKFIDALSPTFWMRFSETSGTVAADSSGNGYTGAYNGGAAVALNQPAIYAGMGPSARFGVGAYCRIPHNTALDVTTENFVVGLAFKRDGTTGRGQFGKLLWKTTSYTNGHANYLLQYTRDTNKIAGRTSINGGADYFDIGPSTTTFADATAYLVCLRRVGDKVSLWVNGAKEAENTLPSAGTALRTSTQPVDIMGGPGSTTDPIIGYGDEAFLIKATLTDTQMADMWAARVDA